METDLFLLMDGDTTIAELVPPPEWDESPQLDQLPPYLVSPERSCWRLDLITDEGRLAETYLMALARPKDRPDLFTRELGAWAKLIVLWRATDRCPAHG
jgi:hypothetical protein